MFTSKKQIADKNFAASYRFNAKIDLAIKEVDENFTRRWVDKAQIKAYLDCCTLSLGHYPHLGLDCSNAINHAADKLEVRPAEVYGAFIIDAVPLPLHCCKFEYDEFEDMKWKKRINKEGFDLNTRIRLACRAGIGMLSLNEYAENWIEKDRQQQQLQRYIENEQQQIEAAVIALDAQLYGGRISFRAAAGQVRFGQGTDKAQSFGKRAWIECNRLYAAGHVKGA
jgi:hypothetical protein